MAVARLGQASPYLVPASKMYLAGELGKSQEAAAERRRLVHGIVFREYLLDVHSLVSRPQG